METTHPPPKPYKSRPNRVQKALNMRKRKTPPLYPQHENRHQLESNKQIQSTIKHISVAQAPPCINMAFPAPSVMPHRNPPMNTPKYKQITHTTKTGTEPTGLAPKSLHKHQTQYKTQI